MIELMKLFLAICFLYKALLEKAYIQQIEPVNMTGYMLSYLEIVHITSKITQKHTSTVVN